MSTIPPLRLQKHHVIILGRGQGFASILSYMEDAVKMARQSGECVPVGAVIVWQDTVISAQHNGRAPYAHAELLALQDAYQKIGEHIREAQIYVTLEPCAMCYNALCLAKIKRIYFGAYDPGIKKFQPEMYGGMCEKECSTLLKQFFQEKRL